MELSRLARQAPTQVVEDGEACAHDDEEAGGEEPVVQLEQALSQAGPLHCMWRVQGVLQELFLLLVLALAAGGIGDQALTQVIRQKVIHGLV